MQRDLYTATDNQFILLESGYSMFMTEGHIIDSVDEIVKSLRYHLKKEVGKESADRYFESASAVASEMIEDAGYDINDSDYFGQRVGDVFQALITAALLRLPHSADEIVTSDLTMTDVFP